MSKEVSAIRNACAADERNCRRNVVHDTRSGGVAMNTSMMKLLGIFALSVALVFLEGLLPERRRIKARSTETRNTKASMRYPNLLAN